MVGNDSPAELTRRFRAADDEEAAALLHALVICIATPVVRQTVKRRFASARDTASEDFEDVCADALAAVVTRLRRYREGAPEIVDFPAYAATVASNLADGFFAARAPQRARLRNRIRYVLTADTRFSMTETAPGVWLCALLRRGSAAGKLSELLQDLLSHAPDGMDLSELTTLAAHSLGITDRTEPVEDCIGFLIDPATPIAHTAEQKNALALLWSEVVQLPLNQRIALLLNLGAGVAGHGGVTLCALAELGVATFAGLADAIGITAQELAAIWNRVPLDDKEIGTRLHLDRQQITNLRASARQRLLRRRTAQEKAGPRTNMKALPDTEGLSE